MARPARTRHTCNNGRGPYFGRLTTGCPRCTELTAPDPVPAEVAEAVADDLQNTAGLLHPPLMDADLIAPPLAYGYDGGFEVTRTTTTDHPASRRAS